MPSSVTVSTPPADAHLETPNEARAEVARLKRCLAASQDELAEATSAKRKKPAFTLKSTLVTMGRGIRKVACLYDSLSSVVEEADRRVMELADESLDDVIQAVHDDRNIQRTCDRAWAAYKILLHLTPQLRKILEDPDPGSLTTFLSQLQEGANGARSDDVRRIKEDLGTWINLEYKPSDLLDPKTRDGQGLQHDVCGGLLSPIQFDWQNPEVRANIRNATEGFLLANKYFLACLYPNGKGNQRHVELNFLKSKLLLKVFCAIFTSPSSADSFEEETEEGPARKRSRTGTQKKATKSNVASLLNMEGKVTGRSIAYAAVMLVFNLTNATQWTDSYNGFNFAAFYNFIVDYFEESRSETSDRRVAALLKWWSSQVFSDYIVTTAVSDESHDLLTSQQDL